MGVRLLFYSLAVASLFSVGYARSCSRDNKPHCGSWDADALNLAFLERASQNLFSEMTTVTETGPTVTQRLWSKVDDEGNIVGQFLEFESDELSGYPAVQYVNATGGFAVALKSGSTACLEYLLPESPVLMFGQDGTYQPHKDPTCVDGSWYCTATYRIKRTYSTPFHQVVEVFFNLDAAKCDLDSGVGCALAVDRVKRWMVESDEGSSEDAFDTDDFEEDDGDIDDHDGVNNDGTKFIEFDAHTSVIDTAILESTKLLSESTVSIHREWLSRDRQEFLERVESLSSDSACSNTIAKLANSPRK